MSLAIVILAAGKGTRMKSRLPKVLHPIAGRPMLQHVVDAARALDADNIQVVYGHGGEQVRATVSGDDLGWADVGYSPAEVVVKEVAEETGIECEVVRPIGVLDGQRRGFTRGRRPGLPPGVRPARPVGRAS